MNKILVLLALALSNTTAAPSPTSIHPSVSECIKTQGSCDIILSMRQKTAPLLQRLKHQSFVTRGARVSSVASNLQSLAESSQKSVLDFLANHDCEFKSYWISNKIFVKAANAQLIQSLRAMEEVESIHTNEMVMDPLPESFDFSVAPAALRWGVEMVEAPAAWAQGFTGRGVVVGILDTGVRGTHSVLRNSFRQERGWLDLRGSGSMVPTDERGHGTHVMGTILGANGNGVAPDAQWMACAAPMRGFDTYLECGQFFLCPTHPNGTEPDCNAAPHVINHSWSKPYDVEEDFLDETIMAWNAAGIFLVWSNGNDGSEGCMTTSYPAYTALDVISVGASGRTDGAALFSSRGPSRFNGLTKPSISAPGVAVTSSSNLNDNSFATKSGTSMAAPHVTGVVALLLTNGTELTFEEITSFIYESASRTARPTGRNCGDIPETEFPNNAVGHGRISAAGAIAQLLKALGKQ